MVLFKKFSTTPKNFCLACLEHQEEVKDVRVDQADAIGGYSEVIIVFPSIEIDPQMIYSPVWKSSGEGKSTTHCCVMQTLNVLHLLCWFKTHLIRLKALSGSTMYLLFTTAAIASFLLPSCFKFMASCFWVTGRGTVTDWAADGGGGGGGGGGEGGRERGRRRRRRRVRTA